VEETAEVLAMNLGGADLRVIDLPRVKIPAQGGSQWQVPTARGLEAQKTLEGVILDHRHVKLYWGESDALGNPPDCVAEDGKHGVGDPGGDCRTCPMNAWGSAEGDSRGKACKDVKQILFLRPDTMIPDLLTLPPTSIGAFKQYMLMLASEARAYYSVITRVNLESEQSDAGHKYSVAEFEMVDEVDEDTSDQLKKIAELMQGLQGGVDKEDYASAEETETDDA
jgi:hypothetical protein